MSMSAKRIRILVADDHAVVRMGLTAMIQSEPDLEVVAEAQDGRQALELYRRHLPDILLTDLRMPELDAVALTQALCREWPEARVIVLSTYEGEEEIYRALQAGAHAYLLKRESLGDEILEAIRAVHAGQRYLPAAVAAALAERMHRAVLTAREIEVLKAVADGLRNKQVASQLQISEATVKVHVTNILAKLGVADRTEAVTVGLRRGIIRLG
jgi:two-component system, NarL family, response regulator